MNSIVLMLTIIFLASFEVHSDEKANKFIESYDSQQVQMQKYFLDYLENDPQRKYQLESLFEKYGNLRLIFIPYFTLEGDVMKIDFSQDISNYININREIIDFDVYVIKDTNVVAIFGRNKLIGSFIDFIDSGFKNDNSEYNNQIKLIEKAYFKIYPRTNLWYVTNNELYVYRYKSKYDVLKLKANDYMKTYLKIDRLYALFNIFEEKK